MSAGVPRRRNGIASCSSTESTVGVPCSLCAVRIVPGATAFTRTPRGPSSSAAVRTNARIPALAAAYGAPDPLSSPEGKEGVRAFYERFIASGAGRLQLDIDRLVVDRDCILTEGVMRMAYPGRTLQAMGITVDDPDAHYLYEARMATLWPFDADGKVLGEDTYTGSDGFAGIADRKLDEADIVEHSA